jgi:septal ring factor EnvC (AmiA/AmiB activator)
VTAPDVCGVPVVLLSPQAEINSLAASLAAERQCGQELSTEVCELESRLAACSAQLSAALSASASHLERYREAKAETASLGQQLEQVWVVAVCVGAMPVRPHGCWQQVLPQPGALRLACSHHA